jgi:hypothetical protein
VKNLLNVAGSTPADVHGVVADADIKRDCDHLADIAVPARLERKGNWLAPQHDLPNLVRGHASRGHSHASTGLRYVWIERESRLLIRRRTDPSSQEQQQKDDGAGRDLE